MRRFPGFSFFFLLLAACPSTAPTPIHISRVEVAGDPTSDDFMLHVTGTGLAPTNLDYDVAQAKGTATADLHLEIFDNLDRAHIPVPREALTIVGSTALDAHVVHHPLAPAVYGVRLFVGAATEPAATAEAVFRVEASDGGAGDAGNTDASPAD